MEQTKMAIHDDVADREETAAVNGRSMKPAVIAELTWAKLYTKAMHRDIGEISAAIRKTQPAAVGPTTKKSAEKLHDQLESANRTVGELSEDACVRSRPGKSGDKT
jgi:hypothetical protein